MAWTVDCRIVADAGAEGVLVLGVIVVEHGSSGAIAE
jgi:hypothetical protein